MKRNRIRLVIYGLLTFGTMVLIFVLSDQNGAESGGLSRWLLETPLGRLLIKFLPPLTGEGALLDIRKYAHIAEYMTFALFSVLFFKELLLEHKRFPVKAASSACLFSFFYACSDEIHQSFIPGRAGQFSDVMIDMKGVLIGVLLVCLISALRKETV